MKSKHRLLFARFTAATAVASFLIVLGLGHRSGPGRGPERMVPASGPASFS